MLLYELFEDKKIDEVAPVVAALGRAVAVNAVSSAIDSLTSSSKEVVEGFADKLVAGVKAVSAGMGALKKGQNISDAAIDAYLKTMIQREAKKLRENNAKKAPIMAKELYKKWVETSGIQNPPLTENPKAFIDWVKNTFGNQRWLNQLIANDPDSPMKTGNKVLITPAISFLTKCCNFYLEAKIRNNIVKGMDKTGETGIDNNIDKEASEILKKWKEFFDKNQQSGIPEIDLFKKWITNSPLFNDAKFSPQYKNEFTAYLNKLKNADNMVLHAFIRKMLIKAIIEQLPKIT